MKMGLLIIGSYFFYAYAGISNLIFLVTATVATYTVAKLIQKGSRNHIVLPMGILSIIILLLGAKYAPVFLGDLQPASYTEGGLVSSFVVPLGVSFYSLQAISMMVDVYKNKYQGPVTLKNISLYLGFFPQSASGPIHRAGELIPQFSMTGNLISQNIVIGMKTMLYGYFCKLIVADKISLIITPVFNVWDKFDGLSVFIAALLYSFQIYFDFWGYSLIAIGVGRVLGFNININFIAPYAIVSFKEFWHRWHITLSRWMRDYIYIPLGGNRYKYIRFCIAIFITFFVSGLWHGVTFNFLLWGVVHAGLYLIEDAVRRSLPSFAQDHSSRFVLMTIQLVRWCLFFLAISFTWLIFRTENVSDLYEMVRKILSIEGWSVAIALNYYFTKINLVYLFIVVVAAGLLHSLFVFRKFEYIPVTRRDIVTDSLFVCTSLIAIILFGDMGGQEFLYFKF